MSEISKTAIVREGVRIGDNVIVEDDVFIDYNCIIRDNVHIGKGSRIGAMCILGEYCSDFYENLHNGCHPLVIGENSLVRSNTIIYGDCNIGDCFQTGHRVTIREHANIGSHVRIGTLSDIQGYCEIEDYVNMHSNVHIAQRSKIGSYVWFFPHAVTMNDPTPPSNNLIGATIEDFAVLSAYCLILPGVRVGKDALIGGGAIVTKDVDEGVVVVGNPAKAVGSVTKIKNRFTGEQVYPWRYTFSRGMPWSDSDYETWMRSVEKKNKSGDTV
jgi:acetyltransferase-like isoleucine patch superfamily enzyme